MNRLIFNYACKVNHVRDGRTFDGTIDLGFRQRWDYRIQLSGVELPEKRESEEAKIQWQLATQCLKLALMVPIMDDISPEPKGRQIIVAPLMPTKFGRSYMKTYVAASGENVVYPTLSAKYAGKKFMDVNHYINLMAENQFDLSLAAKLVDSFDLLDYSS